MTIMASKNNVNGVRLSALGRKKLKTGVHLSTLDRKQSRMVCACQPLTAPGQNGVHLSNLDRKNQERQVVHNLI